MYDIPWSVSHNKFQLVSSSSSQLSHCCSRLRSAPTCHKWHFTGFRFPVVNSNAAGSSRAGCGQRTRGQGGLAIKSQTEEKGRQEGSRGKALSVITYLKQMCCLWMWYLEISLQFSWQPSSAPTQHSLLLSFSLSVRLYLWVTDTFRQMVESFWTPYMCHVVLNHLRQCTYCKYTTYSMIFTCQTQLYVCSNTVCILFSHLIHYTQLFSVSWCFLILKATVLLLFFFISFGKFSVRWYFIHHSTVSRALLPTVTCIC